MSEFGKIFKSAKSIDRIGLIILVLFFVFVFLRLPFALSWGNDASYRNSSVRTTVNVTSAYPEVLNATCNGGGNLILTAGTTKDIPCFLQLRDYDGGSTINITNSIFYFYQNLSTDPDDYNVHYTNSSCAQNSTSGYYSNWTCSFSVMYFANNGTWKLNISVNDTNGFNASREFNITISPLLALNVTDTIDFGNLGMSQTSSPVQANVTNLGNVNMNVSVYGYGGQNPSAGVAMLCEARNITYSNERYSSNSSATYNTMTPINNSAVQIPGLRIAKQVQDGDLMLNSTYWALNINATDNPFGVCNGTVVFSAEFG